MHGLSLSKGNGISVEEPSVTGRFSTGCILHVFPEWRLCLNVPFSILCVPLPPLLCYWNKPNYSILRAACVNLQQGQVFEGKEWGYLFTIAFFLFGGRGSRHSASMKKFGGTWALGCTPRFFECCLCCPDTLEKFSIYAVCSSYI